MIALVFEGQKIQTQRKGAETLRTQRNINGFSLRFSRLRVFASGCTFYQRKAA